MRKSEGWKGSADFFFNDTATTEIYTLTLHDALPISTWISSRSRTSPRVFCFGASTISGASGTAAEIVDRSEEHTFELQLQTNLVCRLLLEIKFLKYI